MANAPTVAPRELGEHIAGTSRHAGLPVTASARVTAGLMWLPEMYPNT